MVISATVQKCSKCIEKGAIQVILLLLLLSCPGPFDHLKIEYQSETDFIFHENLRFKKKEKSLRKIKESKWKTKTRGNIYKITKQSAYSRKKKVV